MGSTSLVLQLEELGPDDEDRWLTCIFCGFPKYEFEPPISGGRIGAPVEFTTTLHGNGNTRGVGVHRKCLERQRRMGNWQGVAYFPTDQSFTTDDLLMHLSPTPPNIYDGRYERFMTPTELREAHGQCEWHGAFTGEHTPCCIHHRVRSKEP